MLDSVELRQEIDHGLSIDGVRTSPTHEKGARAPTQIVHALRGHLSNCGAVVNPE